VALRDVPNIRVSITQRQRAKETRRDIKKEMERDVNLISTVVAYGSGTCLRGSTSLSAQPRARYGTGLQSLID